MAKPSVADRFMPAAREALKAFGVKPDAISLASYSENLTFRVTDAADGAVYALRLHRPGYNSLEELQAEHLWVEALAAAGISVPATVLARDGRAYVETLMSPQAERRFASMTRWQPGRLLSAVLEETPDPATVADYLTRLGGIVARMHEQACAWPLPPLFKRRCLSIDALIGDNPVWGRFETHPSLTDEERRVLLEARDRVQETLGGRAPTPSNFGLIHADIHPDNVIVNGEDLCILDFDDAAFGWRFYDIAVCLFHLQSGANSGPMQAAYLAGYGSVRQLDDGAANLLPFFSLARGLMMMGWFAQRPKLAGTDAFLRLKSQVLKQCADIDPAGKPKDADA